MVGKKSVVRFKPFPGGSRCGRLSRRTDCSLVSGLELVLESHELPKHSPKDERQHRPVHEIGRRCPGQAALVGQCSHRDRCAEEADMQRHALGELGVTRPLVEHLPVGDDRGNRRIYRSAHLRKNRERTLVREHLRVGQRQRIEGSEHVLQGRSSASRGRCTGGNHDRTSIGETFFQHHAEVSRDFAKLAAKFQEPQTTLLPN